MSVMGFNAGLALQAALVTEKAAIAASRLAGQGDEKAADQAAVDKSVQRVRSDRLIKD